jgi:hypothetical protein
MLGIYESLVGATPIYLNASREDREWFSKYLTTKLAELKHAYNESFEVEENLN